MYKDRNETHLDFERNFIYGEHGLLLLPHANDYGVVELFITDRSHYRVSARGIPIRYNRHIGSEVFIGYDPHKGDVNPKFIWDRKEKMWILSTHGYVIFPEIEVNTPERP